MTAPTPLHARHRARVVVHRDGQPDRRGHLIYVDTHRAKVKLDPTGAVLTVDPADVSLLTDHRWTRPDGTLDVTAWCRHLDAMANRGAGAPRPRKEDQ